MPGNEVGDRVHNFFGQENLSPGQHHSQSIEGNWQGLSDNLWVGGQRQIGGPFISSLKNYNLQQPDAERGHASQPSHMPHGLNFTQSNLKHEFGRVQTPNQQPALNGYLHGNQVFQGRQNETNFLGVDADANRHNLGASGLSMSHQGNAPEHSKKNSMRLDASESPVSFDFFGGQQQMSGQHLNVLQSMPRQQSGNSDVQLLQRQMMLQQLQEFQRQQQLQQFDPKQQGFMNQVSSAVKHTAGNHSPSLINGVPISEASNNMWQPELISGGTNWMHRGASPVIHGLSSGHMFPPEQGQALRLMEMVPQQGDQSLYGVPISSTNGPPGPYSHVQMDKAGMQQITPNNNALSANAYASFPDQVSMQEETIQDFQGKSMFGPASGQGVGSGFNMESLQQVNHQQRSSPAQEFQGRQEVAESSEPPQEKFFNQASSSQNAATLDPTEEKILFGSDDNIWEAFGKSTNLGMGGYDMMDGADYSSGCPLQSGSWSALMQSAVAEASSGDTGIQEEWCGPSIQNSEGSTGNQQQSSVNHGGKLQGVWANNNFQPSITTSSWPSSVPVDPSRPNPSISSFGLPQFQQSEFKTSQVQGDLLHSDSSQRSIPKFSEPGSKWSERGPPPKQSVEGRHGYTNSGHPSGAEPNTNSNSGSWNRLEGTPTNNSDTQPYNRPNGWNFIDSGQADGGDSFRTPENKNSTQPTQSGDRKRGIHDELGNAGIWRDDSASNSNAELEPAKSSIGGTRVAKNASSLNNIAGANSSSVRLNQGGKKPNSHKHDFWKVVDPSMQSKGAEVLGRNKQSLDKSSQILETGNPGLERGVETTGIDSINKDYSAEGFQPNVLHHSSGGGSKENSWSDAGDSRMFPGGGKQKSAGIVGRKPPGTRKFQYHPMGDVDVDNDPSYGAKPATNSQTLPHQMSRGFKGYDQGSSGQPMFSGHVDKTSLDSEKENSSASQADKSLDATSSKSMFPRFAPNSSSPFDRGISNFASNKVPPSSQHMLELLHKVDHQREHSATPHLSSSERNLSAEMHETETSDGSVGHVQRNQSSSSQSFGLQLAPPSQCLHSGDHTVSSQSSQKVVFDSNHAAQEAGETGHVYQASKAPAVSFAPSYEPSQRYGHNNATGSSAQIGNRVPYSNTQGTTLPSGFAYARNLENQQMYAASGQIMANQSIHIPFNRISSGSKQFDGTSERAHANHFAQPPIQDLAASAPQDNLASSAETSQLIRTDQAHKQEIAQQITESEKTQVTQLSGHQAAFSKMSPNVWTGVPREQSSLVGQPLKVGLLESQRQANSLITTFPGPSKLNEQHNLEGRNELSGTGVFQANSQNFTVKEQPDREVSRQQMLPDNVEAAQKASYVSQGNESVANNFSEASLASHAATQRDIEAFGRSLRPNNSLQHNYSLLHQVQSMKSTDIEPGDRSTKRLKGPDHVMDHQQVDPFLGGQQSAFAYNGMGRDLSASNASAPSGDMKMLTFSSKPAEARDSNVSSQDAVAFAQNSSNNITSSSGNTPSTRSEHQQINLRMAPSWFDQYGSFKKGQMMQVYDLQKASVMKSVEPNFMVGNVADGFHPRDPSESANVSAEGNQHGSLQQVSAPKSTLSEDLTSPPLVPQSSDQTLVVERPKKRKCETSEFVAWNKELTSTVQRLQTISMAEVEWAKGTNRVAEKVEESETMDEAMPIYRPRRRLVLTTQLMQQLLQPPPLAVLSSDASSQHEALAYFSARLALGDACSATSCSESEDKSTSLENLKTPKAINQYSSKVEDFISRARRLESELLRLDKRASILDLRVECQDLEKFSVINRFAKFHGRGQADGAEASSTDGTTLNAQKPGPQKYVTALPMPRNPPDRVQCLSL